MKKLIACVFPFLFSCLSLAADSPQSPGSKEVILECQTHTERSATSTNIELTATSQQLITEGFTLVGGGCSLEKEQWKDSFKPMLLATRPTVAGNGWYCFFKNHEPTYIIGHARYCKAKLKN